MDAPGNSQHADNARRAQRASRTQERASDTASIGRKRELLEQALEACTGGRQLNYGRPEANFQRIADLWNTWIEIKHIKNDDPEVSEFLSSWEVPVLMILMKLARLANTPEHKDSWLDIAGYAACGYDITNDK